MKHQVIVIHGGEAFDTYQEYIKSLEYYEFDLTRMQSKGWKSGLNKRLGKKFDVIQPRMPNASNARYKEWKIIFEKLIPHLGPNAIFVGHSLGAIFLVKYLSENDFPQKIQAVLLIAAPYNTKEKHPLADFNLGKSLSRFIMQAGSIYLYHSKDDKVVPISNFNAYKKLLPSAEVRLFTNKGHFNQEEFPELIKDIKSLG
jgi:uncharacterized protein